MFVLFTNSWLKNTENAEDFLDSFYDTFSNMGVNLQV